MKVQKQRKEKKNITLQKIGRNKDGTIKRVLVEGEHSIFLLPTLVDLDIVWFDFSFEWLHENTYWNLIFLLMS